MTKSILKANLIIFGLVMAASTVATEASVFQFEVAYTDQSGLSWSTEIPGLYTNGCVDAYGYFDRGKCSFETGSDGSLQVKVDDSNAAKACRDIGARLPTKSEFESLIRDFGHTEEFNGLRLTEAGRTDMHIKFGDGMINWFWSSSVSSIGPDNAFDLNGNNGDVSNDDRTNYFSVRCVSGRRH